MALAHITIDINDELKNLILQLWRNRRLEVAGVTIELPSDRTEITIDGTSIKIEPPAKISGKLGLIRLATTITSLSCDPNAGTITVDLNRSPIDVKLT